VTRNAEDHKVIGFLFGRKASAHGYHVKLLHMLKPKRILLRKL
jgi:hypothetical protein